MRKGMVVTCFKVLSHYLPERREENHERTIFRIAGILAEIRTGYLTHETYIVNEFVRWNQVIQGAT